MIRAEYIDKLAAMVLAMEKATNKGDLDAALMLFKQLAEFMLKHDPAAVPGRGRRTGPLLIRDLGFLIKLIEKRGLGKVRSPLQ